jgi:hypothetical protein
MFKAITKGGWHLTISGDKEVYIHHTAGHQSHFVARFKYARPGQNAKAFAKFLVANFTPEQYFERMRAGHAPLQILAAYGFVSPNQRMALAAKINAAAI